MKQLKTYLWFSLSAILVTLLGCSKALNLEPTAVLDGDKNYNDFTEVRTALLGNVALLRDISPPMVVYNETRGDLVTLTPNANSDLIALDNQQIDPSNVYVDPRPWYRIIMNCNDALVKMAKAKKNDPVNFSDHDSIVLYWESYATRAWCYLQLARMYKEVPFYTTNVESVSGLKYTMMTKEQMADTLLKDLENFSNDVLLAEGGGATNNSPLIFNRTRITNYATVMLKGELYMIKGDYVKAAFNFKEAIGNDKFVDDRQSKFRISNSVAPSAWTSIFDYNFSNTDLFIFRTVYTLQNQEVNYLYNLFVPNAVMYNNVQSYQLKPSEFSVNNWLSQRNFTITNNVASYLPGDKYRGQGASYDIKNGSYYVNKYRTSNAGVFLYRDADMNLLYAEAKNRAGFPDSALNIINRQNTDYVKYPRNVPFKNMIGIRGRVNVDSVPALPAGLTLDEKILKVEEIIVNEWALEVAFEGKRWYTLVRYAERRNEPAFLADRVARKYTSDARAADIRQRLMDANSWYLTFPMEKLPSKL